MKRAMSWLARSAAAVLAVGLVNAAEPAAATKSPWPLWDGKESVADYAKRAGIKDAELTLDLGGGIVMKTTLVPAGKFNMGGRDELRENIEGVDVVIQEGWGPHWVQPGREVTISQPFYMGVHEVTQEQYDQVMGADPGREARYDKNSPNARDHSFRYGYGDDVLTRGKNYPEGTLAWEEAAEFCEKLSAKSGMPVWLPTEAQWEHACKAGTKTACPWGDDPTQWKQYMNYTQVKEGETAETAKETSGFHGKLAPVGSFKPNNWGLYDMLGNVNEWCHDWYTQNYLGAPTLDPVGPGITMPNGGWCHVGRSGKYKSQYGIPDSTGRWSHHMSPRSGFRIVVALKSTTSTPQGAVVSWVLGKGERFLKAPAKAENPPKAVAGPVDPKLRVPAGCRAASGAQAEPYTKSGWAQAVIHEASGMEMVYVPAGRFLMGTPIEFLPSQTERGFLAGEKPHQVTLTRGFYMGKTEVTQTQWEQVIGYNPSLFKNVGPEAPVDTVSWDDCQEFCKKAGGGLRLPTEAEWEYACRAGTEGRYAGELEETGWYLGNSDGTTHPVGKKKPNAWGLYDMHGNVREWCQDVHASGYPDGAATDPVGPAKEGEYRVVRGGSWADYAFFCRSAVRDGIATALFSKGKKNIWEDPKKAGSYGHRPNFGCRFVITAAGAP
ncbi:MAG: formylglycine-generating enzyme family protein [Lentisphaerae bacterium]|nr:formylglycine-generating enzyme family protein [Lentisphaerota bacterium]